MQLFPRILRAASVVLPLFAVILATERSAHAQDAADWTVTEISGDVLRVHGDGRTEMLAAGNSVPAGVMIKTPQDGRAVLTRGDTSMTVSPKSEITLVAEGSDDTRTSIFQKIGSVLYKVEKRSDQHFEVETPFLAAVVKGTSFSVGVNQEAAITHVVEGAVEVTSLGSREIQIVRPGQTATVSRADGMQLHMSRNGVGTPENRHVDQTEPATESPGQEQSQKRVINRTLGETAIDIAKVTDGLATSKSARGRSASANEATSNGTGISGNAETNGVGTALGSRANSLAVSDVSAAAGVSAAGSIAAPNLDATASFPGQGIGVAAGFPGQGNGVADGFPGQGNGVTGTTPNTNPNSGPCNNSGNGNGNGNANGKSC